MPIFFFCSLHMIHKLSLRGQNSCMHASFFFLRTCVLVPNPNKASTPVQWAVHAKLLVESRNILASHQGVARMKLTGSESHGYQCSIGRCGGTPRDAGETLSPSLASLPSRTRGCVAAWHEHRLTRGSTTNQYGPCLVGSSAKNSNILIANYGVK